MHYLILLASVVLLAAYAINWYLSFRRYLQLAKSSGLPYVIVPVFLFNRVWLVTHPLWLPYIRKLPEKYRTWLDFTLPEFSWHFRHEIFERVGSDTFLTCSPGGLALWTADPAVITQITTRRNDFPKPTHMYNSVDIYGKNVVSSEGAEWRHHRKSTSPPFTEKNNHVVWAETLDQTQAMLESWVGKDGKGDKTVDRIMDDTMRLSLHVISRAGFGRKLEWPTDSTVTTHGAAYTDPSKIKNQADDIDPGHRMSYTYSLHCLLDNILFQFLMPRWLLSRLPFARTRLANEAYFEWGQYMREMVSRKKAELASANNAYDQVDIVGQLVRGQVASKDAKNSPPPLTDSEILGNAFVLILAGHETAANSIHFSLLYLALHTRSQRRLQEDLDHVFGGRPPSQWDYERDLPGLFGGMTGAVLNEELRLVPPVIGIPKSTYGVPDQPLMVDGKKCTVPKNTYMSLCSAAVHRHPKHWPHGPPRRDQTGGKPVHPTANLDNDLEEFRPERWLIEDKGRSGTSTPANGATMPGEKLEGGDELGVNMASDTSERLYAPPKGAYIPFSDGYRACLGRRFAQVEVLACLAVIFQKYSVELAVDKYATDEEVERMSHEERKEVWEKAADDCRDLMLNGCGVIITLQMRNGAVSVRFVPRGQEKFDFNL
jgi:cytochrome P450